MGQHISLFLILSLEAKKRLERTELSNLKMKRCLMSKPVLLLVIRNDKVNLTP